MNDSRPRDFLQKDIPIGGIVVYPHRRGSGMWLCKAPVLDVRPQGARWELKIEAEAESRGRTVTRRPWIPAERCVVVA